MHLERIFSMSADIKVFDYLDQYLNCSCVNVISISFILSDYYVTNLGCAFDKLKNRVW